ncbi:hypothetical protein BDP27DRAFT_1212397, partial [Rhodocollybia butyracea]
AEADFNAWYAEEHIHLLSQVPGWQACRRFSLVDSTTRGDSPPRYLALHAYTHLEGFNTPEYKAATNTPWRTRVMDALQGADTRLTLHKALGPTISNPSFESSQNPVYFVSVALSPAPNPEAEADLNAWYAEEHIHLLSQVPGWQACRRFSLVDSTTRGDSPPRYFALHACTHLEGLNTSQYKTVTNTPWRTRVMGGIVATERYTYSLKAGS